MQKDCSLLRTAGHPLDVCKWMVSDDHVIDWKTQPPNLWSTSLKDVDLKINKYIQQKDFEDNNHQNPIEWLKDDIKRCSNDFSVQVTDVAKRMKYLKI